jgi:hypothetical protein
MTTPHSKFASILQNFKLQLPVPKTDGRAGCMEIKTSELMRFSSEHFYSDPSEESLIFHVPDHGATTLGSTYPRSELRDMREWTMQGSEVHTLRGSLKILREPASGKILFVQIHGHANGSECLKMHWDKGKIGIDTKPTLGVANPKIIMHSSLKLGNLIEFFISISNYQLCVTVNGKTSNITFDKSWDNEKLYFKAGNYLNDKSNVGSFGTVAYYSLSDT